MPIIATTEFDQEAIKVDQTRAVKLTITPPAGSLIDYTRALQSINLTAQMNTPLPDDARVQSGYESTTVDITIGGSVDPTGDETIDAAQFFNPDNPTSPLYHLSLKNCPATLEWGLYVYGDLEPELPNKVTCWVDSIDFDWENGSVTLHLIDLDPDWDDTPSLPAVVTAPPYNAGLTNEAAFDMLIRAMKGASTWPALPPNCIGANGFRTTIWPEVGTFDTRYFQPTPTISPGWNGSALAGSAPDGVNESWDTTTFKLAGTVTTHLTFRAWFSGLTGTGPGAGSLNFFYGNASAIAHSGAPTTWAIFGQSIYVTPTGIEIDGDEDGNSVTWNTAIDDGDHYLLVTIAYSGGHWTATATLDGTTHSFAAQTFTDDPTTWDYRAVQIVRSGNVASWVTSTEATPTSDYGWTPIATLDPSLNPLTVIPAITAGSKSWDVMQTIAASECGYVRRDPDGTIRFINRITLLSQPVARSITCNDSLESLTTTITYGAASRAVNISYTEWDFGNPGLVWKLASKKKIPAGKVVTWRQQITDGTLVAQVDGTASKLGPTDIPGHDGVSQYLAALDKFGNGTHPGFPITIAQVDATTFEITADNTDSALDAYLVVPDSYTQVGFNVGDPALYIGGIPVTSGDAAQLVIKSGDGKNPLDFGDNPYLQDHDATFTTGRFVLRQVRWDVREFDNVSIVPDARIQTGDLDQLIDADHRSQASEYVLVWGMSFSAEFPPPGQTGGTWEQTLTTRALGPPDSWLGGAIPDRAEAGQTWAYAA